jgi:hypothetical protein
MNRSVPSQEYIESLAKSIREAKEIKYQKSGELLFTLIDHFCGQLSIHRGRGRRKTYPDRTILKLDMLMHLTGKRGETEILREVKHHYGQYFEQVPDRSRLWYRIRQALLLIEQFRQYLRFQLRIEADLFEKALSIFPNGTPSKDRFTRIDQLEKTGEPTDQLLSSLGQGYYTQKESIFSLAARYLEGHKSDFQWEG